MAEKICMFCEHLQYNSAGHGEYAEPADLECWKGHALNKDKSAWGGQSVYDIEDFRRMILTAQNCPDYKPPNVGNQPGAPKKFNEQRLIPRLD